MLYEFKLQVVVMEATEETKPDVIVYECISDACLHLEVFENDKKFGENK